MLTSSRLYAKEFSFDKSQIRNRLYTKNCVKQMEIPLVSFFIYVIFHITPLNCCFRRSEFNNTRTSTFLSYSIRVSSLLPSPLSKPLNHKPLCLNWMSRFLKQPWSNTSSTLWVIWENILKLFRNCLLWFNHVAVFTVISWYHYVEIFMNFGTKRL